MREPAPRGARPMAMQRLGLLFALIASTVLVGCGTAGLGRNTAVDVAGTVEPSVGITRTPGLFILPALDQTITDPATVNRLKADIARLPAFPSGAIACPVDFGTSYKLVFKVDSVPTETAVISAEGCRGVTLGDGRVLWALSSPSLFADLGAALGLTPDQLQPLPCPAPGRTVCYAQPHE